MNRNRRRRNTTTTTTTTTTTLCHCYNPCGRLEIFLQQVFRWNRERHSVGNDNLGRCCLTDGTHRERRRRPGLQVNVLEPHLFKRLDSNKLLIASVVHIATLDARDKGRERGLTQRELCGEGVQQR